MHPGEHVLTAPRVRALLVAQMPDLAGLPLRRVGLSGTDNVLYRLGPDLLLRFPRLPHAAAQLDRIALFLPTLAPSLPLPVPLPLRLGEPGEDYPFPFLLTQFLPGQPARPAMTRTEDGRTLARTLRALQAQPLPQGAPVRTGEGLAQRLAGLEAQIPQVTEADPAALFALLSRLRGLPEAQGPTVWTHGDLHSLNLLTRRGRLAGLIDWGTLAAGDPAIDLLPTYMVLDGPARDAFLAEMSPSDPALARARAIALSKLVRGLPYYRHSNPDFHAVLRASLPRVLDGP